MDTPLRPTVASTRGTTVNALLAAVLLSMAGGFMLVILATVVGMLLDRPLDRLFKAGFALVALGCALSLIYYLWNLL